MITWKNIIRNTIAHINVAEIAEIDGDKTPLHQRRSSEGPGGRRCSPLGEAIMNSAHSAGHDNIYNDTRVLVLNSISLFLSSP